VADSGSFSAEDSRKLAVLFARAWANPALAGDYKKDPHAVLRAIGVDLGTRDAPVIPEPPNELAAQPMAMAASGSSASSFTCASCPCTGCTASCACCVGAKEAAAGQPVLESKHVDAIMKLAENPEGRAQARALLAKWDVKLSLGSRNP
jgi:hypothetical protein